MKLAVHGILADGAGSGAGAFPVLLRALLERGDRVHFFGIPGFTEPRSLETFPQYRYFPLRVRALHELWKAVSSQPSEHLRAFVSQISHVGYQREAVRRIETEHRKDPYDLIVCTDAQALWPSRLPVVCWPQSPPHTEAAALREFHVARAVLRNSGAVRYGSVQLFYAYRWVLARAALGISDLLLCGSRWAESEWARFGAPRKRLATVAYPIDLEAFERVTPAGGNSDGITFLWLGRAVPRKRLDLFLEAFEIFHRREPRARARLVGNLMNDAFARAILEPYLGHPAIQVEGAWPRARVPELFASVDVLVQPSQNENFGFSVAEALAAGRPVVLGPTNGTADYAGQALYSFGDYRPESVASAMARAFAGVSTEGLALSEHARHAAREHFAIDRVANRFSDLCSNVLARRARLV